MMNIDIIAVGAFYLVCSYPPKIISYSICTVCIITEYLGKMPIQWPKALYICDIHTYSFSGQEKIEDNRIFTEIQWWYFLDYFIT